MKRKLRKIIIVTFLIACVTAGAAGCGASGEGGYDRLPAATNLAGDAVLEEVCKEMEETGLANVSVFRGWAADFADSAGGDAGLAKAWTDPSLLRPDPAGCMDGWEKNHGFSDADCRMTAFLLMDGLITAEKTDSGYSGTYLMFDTDAIESAPRYELLKENLDLFTTLFGDRQPRKGEDPRDVFARVWREYGIGVKSEAVSLLSIVVYDPAFDQAFVGHTGVLLEEGESLLFLEKIAFEQPYQATRAAGLDELLEMLSKRPEYFGGEGDPGPFVYRNGKYIGEPTR